MRNIVGQLLEFGVRLKLNFSGSKKLTKHTNQTFVYVLTNIFLPGQACMLKNREVRNSLTCSQTLMKTKTTRASDLEIKTSHKVTIPESYQNGSSTTSSKFQTLQFDPSQEYKSYMVLGLPVTRFSYCRLPSLWS